MTELQIGDKAPSFSLPGAGGETVSLKDFRGEKTVVYFYPKDDTSGCTKEACDFRDNMKALKKLGVNIVGISKDNVKSHDKFREKYDLAFPLGADEDTKICAQYGVWVQKSMYGRKYMGIERATFLIDEKGVIRAVWRKVKVPGHVEDIIKTVKALGA
jgi:peroxiredoxin Q/BCP